VSLVVAAAVAYVLAGQLAQVNVASLIRHADWRWTGVALVLSALTYAMAATSLTGFVLERLRFIRTLLAQLAASFVTLVTPAAVGGAALNVRYLQRKRVRRPWMCRPRRRRPRQQARSPDAPRRRPRFHDGGC